MRMHLIAVILLLARLAPGPVLSAADHENPAASPATKTGKERLTDKASDEQRVDDCKVPPPRRTHVRPTSCSRY
jgi:hypothetical protein